MKKSHEKKPIFSAIVAMAENHVIGHQGKLPWFLPEDLRHFKATTLGHPVIMGRKTYESIGKPLPGRTNIVLSHETPASTPLGLHFVKSIPEAYEFAQNIDQEEIFVIGGMALYQQTLADMQKIYLTLIHHDFEGDSFFPILDLKEWQEIKREDHGATNERPYGYSFIELLRVN